MEKEIIKTSEIAEEEHTKVLNEMPEIKEEVSSDLIQKVDNKYKELSELCKNMKETNKLKRELTEQLDKQKERFKELALKLNIDKYEDSFVKVSISEIDKSFLRETDTLEYLRQKGLNEFIHTKEYFDYAELVMATTENKIKPEDLASLLEEKKEKRINIK